MKSWREWRVELWITKSTAAAAAGISSIITTYLTLQAHLQYFTFHISMSQTAKQLHHFHFNHHAFFLFVLFSLVFLYHSCSCESEQERWSHRVFNHVVFLQWRRGLHIGHRFIFVVDMVVRGGCRLMSCLREWLWWRCEQFCFFVFWSWDRGRVKDCSNFFGKGMGRVWS